jgi:DHA1 family bicyclomycin/chloramphenicol resistance-like MFS transporter
LVGVLHDGTAVPMAMVISLCGVLTVTISVLTRRLQGKRDEKVAEVTL